MSRLKEFIEAASTPENSLPPIELVQDALCDVMCGKASEAQISAFLVLLNKYGNNIDLLTKITTVIKSYAVQVPGFEGKTMDIVGTGGDGKNSFNISTSVSFIVASGGVNVLKHGNRASSSKVGSADLLELIGANIRIPPESVSRVLEESGFCFLFAQAFHPSMKHVARARKELGIRTIFNIVGPLCNPVIPEFMVAGVYTKELGPVYAIALSRLGIKNPYVVCGFEGLDEVSICGNTYLWTIKDGAVFESVLSPEMFGLERRSAHLVYEVDAMVNAEVFKSILYGTMAEEGTGLSREELEATRDFVLINAALGFHAAGVVTSYTEGVDLSRKLIESHNVKLCVETYIRYAPVEMLLTRSASNAAAKCSILDTIVSKRKLDVTALKSPQSMVEMLEKSVRFLSPAVSIVDAIKSVRGTAVMAEIKRASPSKGVINDSIDVCGLARDYTKGGASVISVLTEPHWFKGSVSDLEQVSSCIREMNAYPNGRRPAVLLKDFVVDELQILEARLNGADSVLLIVKCLTDDQLFSLLSVYRDVRRCTYETVLPQIGNGTFG